MTIEQKDLDKLIKFCSQQANLNATFQAKIKQLEGEVNRLKNKLNSVLVRGS